MTIPGQPEVEAAWHSLPQETRDRIGIIAVDMVFVVVPCVEAFLRRQRLKASEDPVLPLTFLHECGPVANEGIARRIEITLQARDPRA